MVKRVFVLPGRRGVSVGISCFQMVLRFLSDVRPYEETMAMMFTQNTRGETR